MERERWKGRRLVSWVVAGICACLLGSCASQPKKPGPQDKKQSFQMYDWHGDSAKGPASIVIYLDQQKAYFYRGKEEAGWTYVATGKPSHPTPSGTFSIKEKTEDKISNLYGMLLDANGDVIDSDFNLMKDTLPEGAQFKPARMPYYLRLTNDGVGMHAGNIPRPGSTASHGCIRLPRAMAVKFFNNVAVGTPVTIVAQGPEPKN
jgi:lipoprotein-anchoring transpeptidase ErfK/SrfK